MLTVRLSDVYIRQPHYHKTAAPFEVTKISIKIRIIMDIYCASERNGVPEEQMSR